MERLLISQLVLFLTLFLSAWDVYGSGKLEVELEAYTNPHGKGDNGNCCDGSGRICEPHGCDHYFVICLDNYTGDNSIDSCSLNKTETATVRDRDALLFARDAPHLTNPIVIRFGRWRYLSGLKIKVDVWDKDRFNPDDLVERLRRQTLLGPPRPQYARTKKITLRGRTTLSLKLKLYCDHYWFGAACDKFCRDRHDGRYTCDVETGNKICQTGWGGSGCNQKVDPCDSHPCNNNATCQSIINGTGYACDCTSHFAGPLCEVNTVCLSDPCHGNDSQCTAVTTGYACQCSQRRTGADCETELKCWSNPCFNNATCIESDSSYSCICHRGYTGPRCKNDIDECQGHPCHSQQTCINIPGGYQCRDQIIQSRNQSPTNQSGYQSQTIEFGHEDQAIEIVNLNQTIQLGYQNQSIDSEYQDRSQDSGYDDQSVEFGFHAQNQTIEFGYPTQNRPSGSGHQNQTTKSTPSCEDTPCYENQTCRDLRKGYLCQYKNYTENCDMVNSYRCRYLTRTQDTNSSTSTSDGCQPNSCLLNWTCANLPDGYKCHKLDSTFQLQAKYCQLNPCLENQTCNDMIDYICRTSRNQIRADLNDCHWSSCLGDLTCENLSNGYMCIRFDNATVDTSDTLTNVTIPPNDTVKFITTPPGGRCTNHTCQNNGTCQVVDGEEICECSAEWQGKYCESRDACFDQPCRNNGECRTLREGFLCDCASNFTGALCETQIDDCSSQPCMNNATCHDLPTGYLCNCTEDWQGKQCNTSKVKTPAMYCYNGGTLVCDGATCKCQCHPHVRGRYCELRLSPCTRIRCANGGLCHDRHSRYWCICAEGFTGRHCSERINKCANFVCRNNGTCVHTAKSSICKCPQGFTGRHCEVVVKTCSQDSCLNGGRCLNLIGDHFLCVCPAHYAGKLCQTHNDKPHDRKLTMVFDKKLDSETVNGVNQALKNKLVRTFYDPVTVELGEKVGTCHNLKGQTLYMYEFTVIINNTTLNSNTVMEITANFTYSWDLPQPLHNQMCRPEEAKSMDNPKASVEVWMKGNWFILLLLATTVLIVIVVVVVVRLYGRMKPQNFRSTQRADLEDKACTGTKFKAAEPQWCYDNQVYGRTK